MRAVVGGGAAGATRRTGVAGGHKPSPEEVAVTYFDASDGNAHTWWNPRTIKDAGKPAVSADGRTYVYTIPVDTWGVVAAVRGGKDASALAVPAVRALVPEVWKPMDLAIEWGFEASTAPLAYDGRIEAYDGIVGGVRPLAGDTGTAMTGPQAWRWPARATRSAACN